MEKSGMDAQSLFTKIKSYLRLQEYCIGKFYNYGFDEIRGNVERVADCFHDLSRTNNEIQEALEDFYEVSEATWEGK